MQNVKKISINNNKKKNARHILHFFPPQNARVVYILLLHPCNTVDKDIILSHLP